MLNGTHGSMTNPLSNPKFREFFHRHQHAAFGRCLWHTEACANEAIRAHSVQNSGALDLIAEDGHVVMVQQNIKNNSLHVSFANVGRNRATTFTGLCAEHDAQLFRPIDTQPIDDFNLEHLFLVAYRSVLKGFHSALHAGSMVQGIFAKGVELGVLPEDGEAMFAATMQLLGAFQFYPVVKHFHNLFATQSFERLNHVTLKLSAPHYGVAATGVFLPVEAEHKYDPDDPQLLVFNLFPMRDYLYVQFSWRPEADQAMRAAVAPIVAATGDYQLYLLSKFILKYTETFVLAPSLHESFSEQKIWTIQKYFLANANGDRHEWDDPSLYLFSKHSA